MARPKGKLLALLAVFAAIGLVTATGAFTTVTAERTATVDVSGDAGALLGITGANNSAFGNIVTQNNGVAEIDLTQVFGEQGSNAAGINPNANTTLSPLVNFTNNGAEDLDLTIGVEEVNTGGNSDLDSGDIEIVGRNGEIYTNESYELETGDTGQYGLQFNLATDEIGTNDLTGSDFEIVLNVTATSETTG